MKSTLVSSLKFGLDFLHELAVMFVHDFSGQRVFQFAAVVKQAVIAKDT